MIKHTAVCNIFLVTFYPNLLLWYSFGTPGSFSVFVNTTKNIKTIIYESSSPQMD